MFNKENKTVNNGGEVMIRHSLSSMLSKYMEQCLTNKKDVDYEKTVEACAESLGVMLAYLDRKRQAVLKVYAFVMLLCAISYSVYQYSTLGTSVILFGGFSSIKTTLIGVSYGYMLVYILDIIVTFVTKKQKLNKLETYLTDYIKIKHNMNYKIQVSNKIAGRLFAAVSSRISYYTLIDSIYLVEDRK